MSKFQNSDTRCYKIIYQSPLDNSLNELTKSELTVGYTYIILGICTNLNIYIRVCGVCLFNKVYVFSNIILPLLVVYFFLLKPGI